MSNDRTAEPGARLVAEWPWSRQRADQWWRADQLSYTGHCAWNHSEADAVRATRMVVTEDVHGVQDARACCEDCYESVLRYVAKGDAR